VCSNKEIVFDPSECPKTICGDGKCEGSENSSNCCIDCKCPAEEICKNNVCVANCTKLKIDYENAYHTYSEYLNKGDNESDAAKEAKTTYEVALQIYDESCEATLLELPQLNISQQDLCIELKAQYEDAFYNYSYYLNKGDNESSEAQTAKTKYNIILTKYTECCKGELLILPPLNITGEEVDCTALYDEYKSTYSDYSRLVIRGEDPESPEANKAKEKLIKNIKNYEDAGCTSKKPIIPSKCLDKHTAYTRKYWYLVDLMASGKGNTPEAQRAYQEYKAAKQAYENCAEANT